MSIKLPEVSTQAPRSLALRVVRIVLFYLAGAITAVGFGHVFGISAAHRTDRPTGVAPDPQTFEPAIIQVYAARTVGQKAALGTHSWISLKAADSTSYRTFEVVGWRLHRTGTTLVERDGAPDRPWYGRAPTLLLDVRGERASRLIPKILDAVDTYPFDNRYRLWPGPNSNTFLAYLGRSVPQLGLDLPSTAVGKDYRPIKQLLGRSPGGSGVQASLLGLVSFTVGLEEGIEIGLLGLNFELDLFDAAVELPGIGRLGRRPVF